MRMGSTIDQDIDRVGDRNRYRAFDTVRGNLVEISKRLRGDSTSPPSSQDPEPSLAPGPRGRDGDHAIPPPFDFESLGVVYENSNALRQNVDAMATNVDGFGHSFESILDWGGPDIDNQIKVLMMRERLGPRDPHSITEQDLDDLTPSIPEVEARKRLWEFQAIIEKGNISALFEFINPVDSFTDIRIETRESLEIFGNAGWEIIREDPEDPGSRISDVYVVKFVNVRLTKADAKPTEVTMKIRRDQVTYETVKVQRFFRRYVQQHGDSRVWFKELGDPRVMSRSTGKRYESIARMRSEEPDALPAHEFYHWRIKSLLSPYGIPRWIGSLLSVLGSRAAEEVNWLYFDNKAMPPMVLLVSGGRVSEQSIDKIESYIEDRIKGRENFHKIMVLEAVPAFSDATESDIEPSGKMRLDIKPLMGEQIQDALFQDYDSNNIKKVGRSFRQPPIMTGDTADQNRSTAEVAKAYVEEQVYQPARRAFDEFINRHILPDHDVRFWRFKTEAPVQRIPNDLVDNATKGLREGALTPNEARKLLADAFSMELEYIHDKWGQIPPALAKEAARIGSMVEADPTREGEGQDGPDEMEEVEDQETKRRSALKAARALAEFRQAVAEAIDDASQDFFDPGEHEDQN